MTEGKKTPFTIKPINDDGDYMFYLGEEQWVSLLIEEGIKEIDARKFIKDMKDQIIEDEDD